MFRPFITQLHAPRIYHAQFPKLISFQGSEFTASRSPQSPGEDMSLPIKPSELRTRLLSQSSIKSIVSYENKLQKSKTYRRRNVYKSIIRHMYRYLREHKDEMIQMLKKNGFSNEEIEEACECVKKISERERYKGVPKRPKNTLCLILSSKNIYIYILKEALQNMINSCIDKNNTKILQKNIKVYKEVCKKYYNKCTELLTQFIVRSVFIA